MKENVRKQGNFTAGIQYPFRIWDRNLWQGKLSFCGFSGEVRQQVVADPAARTYRIRRLSLSVVFHFCGEPLLYRSGVSDRRRAFDEGDLDGYDFGDNEHYVDYEKIYLSRFKVLKIAFENAKNRDLWKHRNIRSSSRTMPIGWMIMPCIWQ